MDWTTIAATAASAALTALMPLVAIYIQRRVKDARLAQWATGAAAAAGRVAIAVLDARASNPAANLREALDAAAREEARRFIVSYGATARAIGAGQDDALSRIRGEAGRMPAVLDALAQPPLAQPYSPGAVYSQAYPVGPIGGMDIVR